MIHKRLTIGVLVSLLVLSSLLCITSASSPVQSQPIRHTYTFPNAYESGVNFNVTLDTGILIEGGIGSWSLVITASPNLLSQVKNLTLKGTSSGSVVSRGFLVPARDAFTSDMAFEPAPFGFSPLYISELLVVWQDSAGLPVSFSFDLIVTVTYENGSRKDVHLKSDEAVITFIMPNPGELPTEARNFMVACYLSAFLLPLVVVSVNKLIGKRINRRVDG